MKILLTGTAGFIGSQVAKRLVSRGDTVTGVDNFNGYYDPDLKWANIRPLNQIDNFKLLSMDIRDIQDPLFSEQRFDAVIHLAAMPGVRNSIAKPDLYHRVNLTASRELIELASRFETNNFVFASSSSVYGPRQRPPFVESDPCEQPVNPYAATKLAVEQIGLESSCRFGLNFTALRLFSVYGPHARPDLMPSLVANSIVTGQTVKVFQGNFQRDWTFIDDIVDGIVAAVDRPLGFEIINLGRGEAVSLSEFIRFLEREAGTSARLVSRPAPSSEILATCADNTKAARLLDYAPKVPIEIGIKRFWEWYSRQEKTDVEPMPTANSISVVQSI